MRTVLNMLQAVQSISIDDVIDKALIAVEDDYVEAQLDQRHHGIGATGERIGTYKNPAYKAKKLAMNPHADGYVDTRLTGAFDNQTKAKADNEGLLISSGDPKTNMLQGKYPGQLFLLAPANLQPFVQNRLAPATFRIMVEKLKQ